MPTEISFPTGSIVGVVIAIVITFLAWKKATRFNKWVFLAAFIPSGVGIGITGVNAQLFCNMLPFFCTTIFVAIFFATKFSSLVLGIWGKITGPWNGKITKVIIILLVINALMPWHAQNLAAEINKFWRTQTADIQTSVDSALNTGLAKALRDAYDSFPQTMTYLEWITKQVSTQSKDTARVVNQDREEKGTLLPHGTCRVTVNANSVQLRKGPSTDYKAIGQTNTGDPLDVVAFFVGQEYTWYRTTASSWVANVNLDIPDSCK